MNKVRMAAAATLFGAALAVVGAGTASAAPVGDTSAAFAGYAGDADMYSMWEDAQPFAPLVSATDAGGFAQRVCSQLDAGNSEGRLINTSAAQFSAPIGAVRYLIHAAEWHYCPEWY